uniref:Uncharacterized protein n=1 Tax=Avena sativa TaxID=4498 RepID=A0ACD5TBD2_AVESA
MGGGAADERQRRVVPLVEPILDHQRLEMASLPIPDELLGEILLRLPTPADLVRASAACVAFRRVAAERSLLRRYRKLHTPPLVGFLELDQSATPSPIFHPAIGLNQSASAASAVALAGDFSFSFLPAPARSWVLRDTRDGRVLLDRPIRVHNSFVAFPEVVVCDPLHRRYLLLPPITYDLTALVEDPFLTKKKQLCVQTYLMPTCDGEDADETSFRVILMVQCKTRLVAFFFSSNTGEWGDVLSRRWSDLSAGLTQLSEMNRFYSCHYVYGCFYWATADCEESNLLVLDTKTMEFSIAKPPPEANSCCDLAMVETGEGRPGMLVLEDSGSDLTYFIKQIDGGSSSQWQKVKTISLGFWAYLVYNMEKYPLLYAGQGQSSLLETDCFRLDIKTFQLEKVCTLGSSFDSMCVYSNFPPSLLSSPTISNGVENGPEMEMLGQGCAASSGAQSSPPE